MYEKHSRLEIMYLCMKNSLNCFVFLHYQLFLVNIFVGATELPISELHAISNAAKLVLKNGFESHVLNVPNPIQYIDDRDSN